MLRGFCEIWLFQFSFLIASLLRRRLELMQITHFFSIHGHYKLNATVGLMFTNVSTVNRESMLSFDTCLLFGIARPMGLHYTHYVSPCVR